MSLKRKPQVDVLKDLKSLSNEADHFVAENSNHFQLSRLDAWFSAVKDTITKIKNCNSIADIEYPPLIGSYLGEEYNKRKNADTALTEAGREHVHAAVQSEAANKTVETMDSEMPSVSITVSEFKSSKSKNEANETIIISPSVANSSSSCPCIVVLKKINTPETKKINTSITLENNTCSSDTLMQTPTLNRTFSKAINKTLLLGSFSSKKAKFAEVLCVDSDKKSVYKNMSSNMLKNSGSGVVTRSGTKRSSSTSKSKSSKKQKTEESAASLSRSTSKSKSSKKQKTEESAASLSRSTSKSKSSKKQKTEESAASSSRSAKSKEPAKSKSRQPLVDKNVMRTVASENHSKMSAVIMPTVQKKTVVSKEKLISEEIKKKDEKANENIKRLLVERQMKVEQNKKNREERRAKTLQKRMQMEKEKEEKLQKAEAEAKKYQVKPMKENVKNSIVKARTQESIDQHSKASVPGVLSTSKQNIARNEAAPKTPVQNKSDDFDSYDLTPAPNSSTYNFSDDEDDKPSGKPIPQWAQGVQLKSALIQQYYNPPDLGELFGTEIESPDLSKVFCIKKERYLKRTSSAVWNHPPSVY